MKNFLAFVLFYIGFSVVSIGQDLEINKEDVKKDQKLNSKKKSSQSKEELDDGFISQKVDEGLLYKHQGIQDFYFVFNNVGVINKYYNSKKLTEINKNLQSKNLLKAMKLLEAYVSNFGIRNFYEDTDLLWKLAQLYETNSYADRAKAAYLLVLKHHPLNNREQVQDYVKALTGYYDVTEKEAISYVPLEHYYNLVNLRSRIDTLHPPKSVLLNMGDFINELDVPEYGPSISASGDMIVFTRKSLTDKYVGKGQKMNENLYYAMNYGGYWAESVELPEPIKSSCNEGSAVFSNDGKFLVFSRCLVSGCDLDCYDCQGSCDLFYSSLNEKDSTWSKPQNFGEGINSKGWDSQPNITSGGDTIYFASNRPGGFGMSDIYYIVKTGKNKWSKAVNMGPVVNTRGNEWSPFQSKKHDVFYFSSNGHAMNFDDNRRSNDLYKCNKKDGKWLEPKNLGPLVNGSGDETYFSIDSENKFLYYAKTEEGVEDKGITDLYSFPVPMEAQPEATVLLSGIVVDEETGEAHKGIVSVIDLENGIEVAPKFMRDDGTYEFDLIDHNKYLLVIQGDDFFRIEELFELDGDTTISSEVKSIAQKKLQFVSIKFENGKAEILEEMFEDLNNIVNFMVDNPEFNLTIGGHTDSDGNEDFNRRLSQQRADAIKKYLMDNGFIVPDRINAIGYGSTKPIRTPEVTDEDKSINRRVEFKIEKIED